MILNEYIEFKSMINDKFVKDVKMIVPIASREGLINVKIHNYYAYEQTGKLEIFDDRVEISSS